MAQNKMNVLHWHIVDRESFPYTSAMFPNMSVLGAYTTAHIYSIADIKKVLDYARLRGIRVVPEFDTPGHSGSWGQSIPNLLSNCYNTLGKIDQLPDIIDPTIPSNFEFLSNFFTEALDLFGDNYMHFGGDEVESDMQKCWENNPEVKKRMKGMGYANAHELLNYYWQTLFGLIDQDRPGVKKIVWQEVLDMDVNAPLLDGICSLNQHEKNILDQEKVTNAIAHVWKGNSMDAVKKEMAAVTAAGHSTILSSCWYLDLIKYGPDWGYVDGNPAEGLRSRGKYYECDPTDFEGTEQQKALVLGGEAALWGEYVDGTNFMPRMWPSASAVAERLWSDPAQTKSADEAWPRLHEFRCRMVNRGFAAQPPNAPDYCPFEWNPVYQEL
ncbi:unnamed protein product [Heligmosomoides polygyrus]|uniref:beta-N-acetylhexosaminidase n=1 Tax=Heligmosomoides polygyrus TaxID=6339 RepID=A0A3P8ADB1_HELPZ|nr:unnamed protein product [Heligmosomoides polygyrus]